MYPRGRTSGRVAAVGLIAAGLAACQPEEPPLGSRGGGEPELQILASATCGNALPITDRQELESDQVETAAIQVQGIDPSQPNRQMLPGTNVILYVGNQAGDLIDGTGRFVSNPRPDNPRRITSRGVQISGGQAVDEFFCTSDTPGVVYLHAIVQDYPVNGQPVDIRTRPGEGFPIRCMSDEEWECQCFGCPDAAVPLDGGADAGDGGAGDADVGIDAQRAPNWSLAYVGASSQNLEIGIRGSYREGRTDSIDLTFRVTEFGEAPSRRFRVRFGLGTQTVRGVAVEPQEAETDAEGFVTTQLRAGDEAGVVAVTASVMFPGEDEPETVSSPPIAIRGGIPSQRGFGFQCAHPVIPAFTGRLGPNEWLLSQIGEGTTCYVQLVDRISGRVDQETQVFFMTEAGNVNQSVKTDGDGLAETELKVGPKAPTETEPMQWEVQGNYVQGDFNPRDGLVRIIAMTRGEEDFTDMDGARYYDPDVDLFLPEHDLAEPFVDANDNGEWDRGEEFRDLNNNGVWDESNGVWDNNTVIWVDTTVLWVGNLDERFQSRVDIEPCAAETDCYLQQPAGMVGCAPDRDFFLLDRGHAGIRLRLADQNGNCLDGYGEGTVNVGVTGPVAVVPSAARSFDLDKCFLDCGPDCPGAQFYTFAIADASPLPPREPGEDPPPAQNFEVNIVVTYRGAGNERHEVAIPLFGCVQ